MLIFITGYMGAGKTTLGKRLAEMLDYNFYDMDEMVEISTGYSIRAYFEKFGESSFRVKERKILLSLSNDTDTVIATGGGTACYADNMDLMNRDGITIFMETKLDTILNRLTGRIHQRPLLKNIPADQLPSFIQEHLKNRMEFYSKARIRVEGEDVDIEALVDTIRHLKSS
jgi:shikimate kinase